MPLNTLLDAKLIYHTDTVIQLLFDLFLPKVYRHPPDLFEQDIVPPVPRDIFFDLLYPVLTIGFEFEFPVFPIVPMPKLTINKNRDPIYPVEVYPKVERPIPLKAILETGPVEEHFFLREEDMPRWTYAKRAKRELRRRKDGSTYYFSEGVVAFPEPLEKPSRTMLTSEGQVGRSSHVVPDPASGRLRLLTPIECERLNGFPDNWTNTGMPERIRYFVMGNAVVVPLVSRIGEKLLGMT